MKRTTPRTTKNATDRRVRATEFNYPDEAIVSAEEKRGLLAIEWDGRWFTIAKRDAERLLKDKVRFAYLRDRKGEVYTVRAR